LPSGGNIAPKNGNLTRLRCRKKYFDGNGKVHVYGEYCGGTPFRHCRKKAVPFSQH